MASNMMFWYHFGCIHDAWLAMLVLILQSERCGTDFTVVCFVRRSQCVGRAMARSVASAEVWSIFVSP